MKIIVVSDSHGNYGGLKNVIEKETPFDLAIHLGDGVAEMELLRGKYGFPLEAVTGNNDPPDMYPETLKLHLGAVSVFLSHGHKLQVHQGYDALLAAAKREKCRWVIFGHTHRHCNEIIKGVRLLNPGSVCAHLSQEPGYLVLRIEGKKVEVEMRYLKELR